MKKNKRVEFMCSSEEYSKIEQNAKKFGLSVSAFIRLILLRSQIKMVEIELSE